MVSDELFTVIVFTGVSLLMHRQRVFDLDLAEISVHCVVFSTCIIEKNASPCQCRQTHTHKKLHVAEKTIASKIYAGITNVSTSCSRIRSGFHMNSSGLQLNELSLSLSVS